MAKAKWDDACASAYLLKVAAALTRDETPFHQEIEQLCKLAYRSLRTHRVKGLDYIDDTVMPEERFRHFLFTILSWEPDDIDQACREVRADAREKNRPLQRKQA